MLNIVAITFANVLGTGGSGCGHQDSPLWKLHHQLVNQWFGGVRFTHRHGVNPDVVGVLMFGLEIT